MVPLSKRKALACAASVAAFLIFFVVQMVKAESEDRLISLPAPMPIAGGSEVRLPYPPGPDFSWFRKDNLSLKGLTDSKPAVGSSESHRLVAGASHTVGKMPWYIQVLVIILIAILFVGSYFYYRYGKSKRLINGPAK